MGFYSKLKRVTVDSLTLAVKVDSSATNVAKFIFFTLVALGVMPSILSVVGLTEIKDVVVPIPLILSLSIGLFIVIAIVCFAASWVKFPRLSFVQVKGLRSESGVTNVGVKIKNDSGGKTIKGCHVELMSLDPPVPILDYAHIGLHCSGVEYPIETVPMHAQSLKTFDVFTVDAAGVMRVAAYQKDLFYTIEHRAYPVTLRASGDDIPPTYIEFKYKPGSTEFPLSLPSDIRLATTRSPGRVFKVNPKGDPSLPPFVDGPVEEPPQTDWAKVLGVIPKSDGSQ